MESLLGRLRLLDLGVDSRENGLVLIPELLARSAILFLNSHVDSF
jgi:hypothetical protein